jgi:hypothetical protein
VAGAQFALIWMRKWKSKIDFDTISKGFPPHRSKGFQLKRHLDATLDPAKRMIDRLLEDDSGYFEEHHYLDPIFLGPTREQNLCKICIKLYIYNTFQFYQSNVLANENFELA